MQIFIFTNKTNLMRYYLLILLSLFLVSCNQKEEELTAQEIVDKAIEKAGGQQYENAKIDFVFRGMEYKSLRQGGKFKLERIQTDSADLKIRDVLTNESFKRFIDDSLASLPDSLSTAYSNSVNSVHYFIQLPYGLNSSSVNKKLVAKDSIEGRYYYEIKVGFDKSGGGKDYEDEYLYWIDNKDFTVDYLAYNYHTDGGGVRFRKAINPRMINGIRFVDYENYSYKDKNVQLSKLDSLYEAGKLKQFSVIKNEDITVTLNPDLSN